MTDLISADLDAMIANGYRGRMTRKYFRQEVQGVYPATSKHERAASESQRGLTCWLECVMFRNETADRSDWDAVY